MQGVVSWLLLSITLWLDMWDRQQETLFVGLQDVGKRIRACPKIAVAKQGVGWNICVERDVGLSVWERMEVV